MVLHFFTQGIIQNLRHVDAELHLIRIGLFLTTMLYKDLPTPMSDSLLRLVLETCLKGSFTPLSTQVLQLLLYNKHLMKKVRMTKKKTNYEGLIEWYTFGLLTAECGEIRVINNNGE